MAEKIRLRLGQPIPKSLNILKRGELFFEKGMERGQWWMMTRHSVECKCNGSYIEFSMSEMNPAVHKLYHITAKSLC